MINTDFLDYHPSPSHNKCPFLFLGLKILAGAKKLRLALLTFQGSENKRKKRKEKKRGTNSKYFDLRHDHKDEKKLA